MCSAPNVYMFVYMLIGTHMVPLSHVSLITLLQNSHSPIIHTKSSWLQWILCALFISDLSMIP